MESMPNLGDVQEAARRLDGIVWPSPLIRSHYFSRLLGAETLLKLENLQETGSFKVRGAYNCLSQLRQQERKKGVIAASAGNHAQGVAWSAQRLDIHSTIVMPEDVPIKKLDAVRDYGAEVILHGSNFNEALTYAEELSEQTKQVFIPGFDDPRIIAGQGTVGLEVAEALDDGVAVVASVGGGGFISGLAIATKALCPGAKVIGVQTESCPSTIRSLEENHPVTVEPGSTIADGIAVSRPGELNFKVIQKHVDEVVSVGEEDIAGAVLRLLEKANIIAEGAGAAPLAAVMNGETSQKVKRYILMISGGNIEINTIDRILQRGSIQMGRLIRVEANIPDVPGSLWKLLGVIADGKANILHILHDRLDLQNPLGVSRVVLNLETRGYDHSAEIVDRLREAGYPVRRIL
jgi:threonine dehydratase